MDRLWLIGGVVVLVLAAIFGWLTAGRNDQLDSALILADVTTASCTAPGQVHLTLGNAAGRVMNKVEGVLSVAANPSAVPDPVGNFELSGPLAPGAKLQSCVPIEEPDLAGRDRATLVWLARATAVEFGD